MSGRVQRLCNGLVAILAIATSLSAQTVPASTAVLPDAHARRWTELKLLVARCSVDAASCKPESVGPDERVDLGAGRTTLLRLDWLRTGLHALATEKEDVRKTEAGMLEARLARLDAPADPVAPAVLQSARSQVDQVLATSEFKQEPELTWLQRLWRGFTEWLLGILGGSFAVLSSSPAWLRQFFQALLFLVPAVLLILWLMRQAREDRLHPERSAGTRPAGALAPQTEWLALADEFARANDWRQAIHALYWASIAGFEARRVWQSNRTRTPREYLRLLKPDSAVRGALAEQTRLFELTWYGYREATHDDYQRALQLESSLEAL